jgi:hypothetical protein
MRKVISSPFTFFLKFVFPGGWLAPGLYALAQGPAGAAGIFICLWLCVSLLLFRWSVFPLKKVSLGEGYLRVSNFWREVAIPLSAVESVQAVGYGWPSWHLPGVVVRLRAPSEFGARIRFIPGRYYRDVVAELSRAAERSGVLPAGGRA